MIGRDTFSALAPDLGPKQNRKQNGYVTLFHFCCVVHGGQLNGQHTGTKLIAAFAADKICGNMLEPARMSTTTAAAVV